MFVPFGKIKNVMANSKIYVRTVSGRKTGWTKKQSIIEIYLQALLFEKLRKKNLRNSWKNSGELQKNLMAICFYKNNFSSNILILIYRIS